MKPTRDHIALSVSYGLGATATTSVPRDALRGCTVRGAIEIVLKAPYGPGSPEERTALLIAEAFRSGRHIDIEVDHGRSGTAGTPVALDDVVDGMLSGEDRAEGTEGTAMESELRFSCSESYRGGAGS